MNTLQLTKQVATDLNDLCDYAVGQKNGFGITYYHSNVKPEYELPYLYHLLEVARQYENVHKLINISSSKHIHSTHNTKYFLQAGGFMRFYEKEKRERQIERLTLYQIKSVLDTNTSVRRTNTIQRNVLFITIGVSLLTLFVEYLNYLEIKNANHAKPDSLELPVKDLKIPKTSIDTTAVLHSKTDSVVKKKNRN